MACTNISDVSKKLLEYSIEHKPIQNRNIINQFINTNPANIVIVMQSTPINIPNDNIMHNPEKKRKNPCYE